MERDRTFRELVQEKKKKLMKEEILESVFYKEMLLSVAGELTGGTLKKVKLVKLPESGWAGRCNERRVLLNIENRITASFPSVPLKSDSITRILGHECGHWNFTDFRLRKKYLEGLKKGEWYLHPPKPETSSEAEHLEEINGYLKQKHEAALALLMETASFIQNILEDVYVEQKMCERYPGSIRRGIKQNRTRNVERIPSLKVQMENGYKPVAVLLNLMAQYSLTGTINNWEEMTGGPLELLELTKPVIDAAVTAEDAEIRMGATNRILLMIWKVLLEEISETEKEQEKQQKEEPQNQLEEDGGQAVQNQPEGEQDQQEKEGQSGESQSRQGETEDGPDSQSQQQEPQSQQEKEGQSGELQSRQGETQDEAATQSQKQGIQSQQEKEEQSGERQGQQRIGKNQQERENQQGESVKNGGRNRQKAQDEQKEQEESQQSSTEDIQRMLEQLREQLPEFLLEKDGEEVEGNLNRTNEGFSANTLLPKEQIVETRDRLMEYIQGAAEEQAEKELEERFSRELSRELSETEFDGDHTKVKKVLERETRFPREAMIGCDFYENQVRAIMRRMKARLLPVLSCQSPHMERNLFFGSQVNYQALYNPEKRIFCNLEVRKKVNTAVALLIDMSGSMLGKRMEQARLCALCLYEFCKSAGIPVLIYGHHTDKLYRRV